MQVASNTQSGGKWPADVVIYDTLGNPITSFGGSGGTSHTDDAAFTIGSASSITPIGALADEAATDSVDEGDVGVVRMTLSRKLLTVISDQNSETHADVLALTNFHPLAVALVDTNGDQISSFGGGTQYTEDAAAAANPVGTAVNLVRQDTPAGLVSTDGDNVAQRGTNFGAAFVQILSSAGTFIDSFGGGTQYTEDAAAAANPVGTALNLVRLDNPSGSLVSADGDNIAARGSNHGALYTTVLDNLGASVDFAIENGGNLASIAGAVRAEDEASASGQTGLVALAIRQDTPANTSGTDGDYEALRVSAGRLWASAVVTAVPADPFGVNADAASATGSISAKLRFIASTGIPVTGTVTVAAHAVTNAGTFAVQESGAALTSLQLIDDVIIVDDAAFTPGTTKVAMVGFQADETSTDSVDEGDAGAARMTLDRKQIVTCQPHTQGGCLVANFTSEDGATVLSNAAQAIKASAGQIYGWYIYNPNATAVYVHLYNVAAGSVTVGTTNPQFPIVIPPTSAANILGSVGIEFTNAGFSTAATTTGGGNTAPGIGVEATFFYK